MFGGNMFGGAPFGDAPGTRINATAAVSVPHATVSVTATETISATAEVSAPHATVSATATQTNGATASVTCPHATCSATGTVTNPAVVTQGGASGGAWPLPRRVRNPRIPGYERLGPGRAPPPSPRTESFEWQSPAQQQQEPPAPVYPTIEGTASVTSAAASVGIAVGRLRVSGTAFPRRQAASVTASASLAIGGTGALRRATVDEIRQRLRRELEDDILLGLLDVGEKAA